MSKHENQVQLPTALQLSIEAQFENHFVGQYRLQKGKAIESMARLSTSPRSCEDNNENR